MLITTIIIEWIVMAIIAISKTIEFIINFVRKLGRKR
jgi:hypothetical protein